MISVSIIYLYNELSVYSMSHKVATLAATGTRAGHGV